MWSRREEYIAFKASLLGGVNRRLIWWPVKALSGPVTLKQMNICTLAHLAFCALVGHGFSPLWRLVMGTPVLHRCLRQTSCPPVFEHYLILFWLTPTDWLWIRQPPYPLVSAVKGQPWLRVFFKAFQSNYNSLSLIKLVPPQHSVMFFLATPQLEELLVVFPEGQTYHFAWLWQDRQIISTSVTALRQNGAGRNQGSGVEEITPPPKSLDCDPGLWRENKKRNYRNIPCCHWSWILLLLLWASEDSFILLLESLQLYCIGLLSCHAVLWVPVCWLCCWQCQTDRRVNAPSWANLVLATCTSTHKCATLLLNPRMADCSYKNH